MRFFILLSLFVSQSLFAAWTGTYSSVTQQGMAVEINTQNEYLLYVVQNNQVSPIETGLISFQDNQLVFTPQESVTGVLTSTTATIIKEGCEFSLGQAGEFKSSEQSCQSTQNIISTFRSESGLIEIPQLGLPNASGGFDLYKVTLKLLAVGPLQFQVTSAEPIHSVSNSVSGVYSPEQQLLYLPMLAVNPESPQILPVYQLFFKVTSLDPIIITQYQAFQYQYQTPSQYQAPSQNRESYNLNDSYASAQQSINDMSNVLEQGHENMMTIINSMGDDGDCRGNYDPSRGCY
jgi:hypothetical protein